MKLTTLFGSTYNVDPAAKAHPARNSVVGPGASNGIERGPQDAAEVFNGFREGSIRVQARKPMASPFLYSGAHSHYVAEQYRIIRTGIAGALKGPFLMAVSSPGVADGKTLTTINLATAFALAGEGRTLLIDADLRGASVHKHLGIDSTPGLTEVLAGKVCWQDALVRFDNPAALYVLPGGTATGNPTDALDSRTWRELAAAVKKHFAQVVLDCPPVNLFADFDLIASVCDGVVGIIRPDYTNRTLCLAALTKMRPKLIGIVINGADDWFLWKKSTRKYYSHYGSEQKRARRSAR